MYADDQAAPEEACVGIVWGVCDAGGPLLLVTDRTSLAEAERYGNFLTHPGGHYDVWERWRRLGLTGLARRSLPAAVVWHEYEHFPRGRVVFDTTTDRFTLYADRKLQAPATLPRVLHAFGLDPTHCTVRSDPHYRATFRPARPADQASADERSGKAP